MSWRGSWRESLEARRLLQVKHLSREELEGLALWLAERIEDSVESVLRGSAEVIDVKVEIGDEWPYTVNVEVYVKTRYPKRGLGRILDEVLEQAFREFAGKAEEKGIQAIS